MKFRADREGAGGGGGARGRAADGGQTRASRRMLRNLLSAEEIAAGRERWWDGGMTDVLVLGGTGWVSGEIARRWLDRGARVTCLARGGRDAPYGATLAAADRDAGDAYDDVAQHEWDEVVDISSNPAQVAAALDALGARARHWTYVSSVSVYADSDEPGADESAALASPVEPGDEYDYSRAKSAAEESVRAVLGERAAILRPGLIVGAGRSHRPVRVLGRALRARRGGAGVDPRHR